MAESQDLEQQCVTAFKQGNHDQAVQLLPQLKRPGDVTTEFNLNTDQEEPSTDVTLLHIAAYYGWLDIIETMEGHFSYNCKDSNGCVPLYYATAGNNLSVVHYLITEQGCDPITPNSNGNLPLHIACLRGYFNATKYFISKQHCDPTSPGQDGYTPLHYASEGGRMNIIQYLITELGCDPTTPNSDSNQPLHIACLNNHLKVVKYFITRHNCDPNIKGNSGFSPLHFASSNGHMNIIQHLVTKLGCDPTTPDNYGSLPLHIACLDGHLNVAKYFITEKKCDPSSQNKNGFTPLHCGSEGGHMNIIQYLITELGCDPTTPDSYGNLTLHIACLNGHLNATKYFITEQKCDPSTQNKNGSTPLHYASQGGHMNIIQYLISELGCDPSLVDNNCRTVLHLAAIGGHAHVIQWLLCDKRVGLIAKDKWNKTCIDLANENEHNHLFSMFNPLLESFNRFPIHTFSKTVLTGNSGAGKTTMSKVINEQANNRINDEDVEIPAAGIVPSLIMSSEVGNMVLYDLAGQAEYQTSHSAVMETVMQQSPATFIIVVDLSNSDNEIIQQLHYWLNFIENATCESPIQSCLVIVGTHVELDHEQLKRKSIFIKNKLQMRLKRQENIHFVAINYHQIDSAATREFISQLHESHHTIVARLQSMSCYCHLLYAFLKSKLEMSVCTLEYLISLLAQSYSIIPSKATFITELLTTLSGRGLIIFLKNQQQLEKSWIVGDIESLLKKVNKEVFLVLNEFKDHRLVGNNTGIIRSSILKQLFPQFNIEMLVGFLQTLDLCHCVNLSGNTTNLQKIETFSLTCSDNEDYFFFFPSLLANFRPITYPIKEDSCFGWCLHCKETGNQYFTCQFLHVLLLRLAYSFPLASTTHLHRKCTLWTNGIFWDNEEGIQTTVELIDHNRCVIVVMSHESTPVEFCKHRSSVIRLILDLQKQLCPNVEAAEYLTSRLYLRNWSATENMYLPCKNDLLPIENAASSMLYRRRFIFTSAGYISDFRTKHALKSEPYYQLSPSSVCELMDSSKADEPASQTLINEVEKICQVKQQSYSYLRKVVDEMSIFTGKNPIVSKNSLMSLS